MKTPGTCASRACLRLFIIFLIFNIGDGLLTIISVNSGANELNPFVQYFISGFGLEWGIFWIKLLSSILGLFIYIVSVLGNSSNYVSNNINPDFTYYTMLTATVIMGLVILYHVFNIKCSSLAIF